MNDHQVYAAVAIVVVLAMALWLALKGLRRAEETERRHALLEAELAALRDALARSTAAAEQASLRQAGLEQQVSALVEQQEQLRLRDEGSGGYSHAIRLAQRGASADELVRDCGLNRGEAELVISLHGRSAAD